MLSCNIEGEPFGIHMIAPVRAFLKIQRGQERIHDTGPGQHLPNMIRTASALPYIDKVLQCILRQFLIGIIIGESIDGQGSSIISVSMAPKKIGEQLGDSHVPKLMADSFQSLLCALYRSFNALSGRSGLPCRFLCSRCSLPRHLIYCSADRTGCLVYCRADLPDCFVLPVSAVFPCKPAYGTSGC